LSRKRIAVVVQRYGEEVNGGAELHARWLAERLTALAEVHAITTCAVDYHTWENAYPPGETLLNGVRVHRFRVDAPRKPDFQEQTVALLKNRHSIFKEVQWVKDQGPYSTGLLTHLREAYNDIDLFIFVTYLYPPAFFGLPLVSDKAVLVPTAHDEPYLRFPAFRSLFHLPQAIIYNTEPEKQLVNEITQNDYIPQIVAGVGVNTPADVSAERFRQRYGVDRRFLVYVGRVDEAKNVPELLDFFMRYRADTGEDLKLVLIGKANMSLPVRDDIVSLGFIPEEDKFDAIRAAEALMMPSLYESLSMVALEAWLMETPTLLNGRCDVLKYQCRQSNAGLYYFTYDEFVMTLNRLLGDPELRAQLGRQGKAFVAARYDWDIVMAKYRAIVETLTENNKAVGDG
jgi:glycosyltransferase involved in cell wall biosynthesis